MHKARTTLILATLAVATLATLAAPSQAQPALDQAHIVRAGTGDIPATVDVQEPAGFWNVDETRTTPHTTGNHTDATFTLPVGSTFGILASSNCNGTTLAPAGNQYTYRIDANTPSGDCTLTFTHRRAVDATRAFGFTVTVPSDLEDDTAIILYLPKGYALTGPRTPDVVLPSALDGDRTTMHAFYGTTDRPLTGTIWFAAAPSAATTTVADEAFPWIPVIIAVLIGALGWAFLVQRGIVQKRSRKQVAAVAAHKEVASKEPRAVLEGRKRVLMAALKELEVAKMNGDMDVPTYDALKAELKRETVTVMRALEAA